MYQSLIKPFYQDIKKFVLDTIFPVQCLVCKQEGSFICSACKHKLAKLERQYCVVCEKPSVGGLTHPFCRTPHGADGLISIFDYHDENIANAIIKGKYSFIPGIYKALGLLMADHLKAHYADLLSASPLTLTPLPLFWWRRRWRGFNQAEVLCETLSRELNLPYTNALVRCKFTKTQKDIKKREQRTKNVEGAFSLSPFLLKKDDINQFPFDVHGQNFFLVDDVVTTGSTLLEAAKVLKRNGANKVYCLTVARD